MAEPLIQQVPLSANETAVLELLKPAGAQGETTIASILEDSGVDGHRIFGLLTGLQRRGLVQRRSAASWTITRAGRRVA